MKKKEIIDKIDGKLDDHYRSIAKDYLKHYAQFNDFEKAIFTEIIGNIIEKHYSLEQCFTRISNEYNVNCKRIVFFAMIRVIKMPTIKAKFLFFSNVNEVISQCINFMKSEVVNLAFKCA